MYNNNRFNSNYISSELHKIDPHRYDEEFYASSKIPYSHDHYHTFAGNTSKTLDHGHEFHGETLSIINKGDKHIHYYEIVIELDNGYHKVFGETSPPIIDKKGGHMHFFKGITSVDKNHIHFYEAYTSSDISLS